MGTVTTELKEEGYKLMGAAFEVYNEQGNGLAEEIYQESMEIELELRQIPCQSKQEFQLHAHRPRVGGLPRQLRPQRHAGMEAIHPDKCEVISVD